MAELRSRGLDKAIQDFSATGRPLMGICLGMQLLFEESSEFGNHPGLGVLPGRVVELPAVAPSGSRVRLPHIGWTPVCTTGDSAWQGTIMEQVPGGGAFYFVHSFHVQPGIGVTTLAVCHFFGLSVVAAVQRANVVGVQFHPEKSGPLGLTVLRQFSEQPLQGRTPGPL
jgi:glutamine amidotransferase